MNDFSDSLREVRRLDIPAILELMRQFNHEFQYFFYKASKKACIEYLGRDAFIDELSILNDFRSKELGDPSDPAHAELLVPDMRLRRFIWR